MALSQIDKKEEAGQESGQTVHRKIQAPSSVRLTVAEICLRFFLKFCLICSGGKAGLFTASHEQAQSDGQQPLQQKEKSMHEI